MRAHLLFPFASKLLTCPPYLPSWSGCATLPAVHTSLNHASPPLPPTQRGSPAAQGHGSSGALATHPLELPLPSATCAASGDCCPCCWQGPSQVPSGPERGPRMLIFLWLLVGQSRFVGTGPIRRACQHPYRSGSRNGTLLFLSVHTAVTAAMAPNGPGIHLPSRYLGRQPPK